MSDNSTKIYIEAIDCYRGLAALFVTTIHLNINTLFGNTLFKNGLFVQLFFVISGYVLYINYHKKLENLSSFRQFLKKRFLRLYPLHLFFLLLFLILEVCKLIAAQYFGIIPNRPVFVENNFSSFVYNLFLIQNFFGSPGSYNGPSWSISAEFFTYIIFAFTIIFFKKKLIYILILYIFIFIFYFSNFFNYDWGYNGWLSCMYSFSIGVIFAKIYLYKKLILKTYLINSIFLITLILTIFFIGNKTLDYYMPFLFGYLLYITSSLSKISLIYKIVFNKFLIFLGKISYSIYLSHVLIYWCMTQFMKIIIKWPSESNESMHVLKFTAIEGTIFFCIFIFLTISISIFTYSKIEKRFYKKLK